MVPQVFTFKESKVESSNIWQGHQPTLIAPLRTARADRYHCHARRASAPTGRPTTQKADDVKKRKLDGTATVTIDRGEFTTEERFLHRLRTDQQPRDSNQTRDCGSNSRQHLHTKLVQKKQLQSKNRVSGATYPDNYAHCCAREKRSAKVIQSVLCACGSSHEAPYSLWREHGVSDGASCHCIPVGTLGSTVPAVMCCLAAFHNGPVLLVDQHGHTESEHEVYKCTQQ